jgi:threonine dehydrogenase-like Zn-dependent dehydrogenase
MELLGSGAVDLKPLMDLQCKLSDWRTGFDAVISKSSYKVVLIPEHDFDE